MPTEVFHNCLGPPAGHWDNQSVSREMPFRSGPRQCGQSAPKADVSLSKTASRNVIASVCRDRMFMNFDSHPSPGIYLGKSVQMLRAPHGFSASVLLRLTSAFGADWPHWRGPDRNGISRETDWLSQ